MTREWKIAIVGGLISSAIFLYLLDPILRLISYLLFGVGGNLLRAYTDRLFAQAALLAGPDPSLFLLTGTCIAMSGIVTAAGVVLMVTRRADRPHPLPRGRAPVWVFVLLVVIFDALTLFFLYNTFFQIRIVTSFNQHLTAVAPFISDDDEERIRSRWTQMSTKSDYDAIYAELRAIAETHGIKLPANRVFTPTSL